MSRKNEPLGNPRNPPARAKWTRHCGRVANVSILLFLLGGFASADEKRPLQPKDILNLSWAIRPQVSPDGKLATTAVQDTDTVYALDIATRAIVTEFKVKAGSAAPPLRHRRR